MKTLKRCYQLPAFGFQLTGIVVMYCWCTDLYTTDKELEVEVLDLRRKG